jgi:hypothetical protein
MSAENKFADGIMFFLSLGKSNSMAVSSVLARASTVSSDPRVLEGIVSVGFLWWAVQGSNLRPSD